MAIILCAFILVLSKKMIVYKKNVKSDMKMVNFIRFSISEFISFILKS